MTDPLEANLIYYGDVAQRMHDQMIKDPRDPKDWSDADKLRLLADLFDAADLLKENAERDVQEDLRRMADRLDVFDLPEP